MVDVAPTPSLSEPSVESRLGAFRALGDPTRLRVLLLLRRQSLTVSELMGVLESPQSSVSGVLRLLGDAGLVGAERDGRHARYVARPSPWLDGALSGVSLTARDLAALEVVREARLSAHGDTDPGRAYDRGDTPGRSWRTLAEGLLLTCPLGVVADLGVGEGELTLLLARSAARVYAVDHDGVALEALAARASLEGLAVHPVRADIHSFDLPEFVDLVTISLTLVVAEAPDKVLAAAVRALRPGGRVWVTDLAPHDALQLRERHGHRRLGFHPDELTAWLTEAGLVDVRAIRVPASRRGAPFDTVVAVGQLDPLPDLLPPFDPGPMEP